MTPAGFRPRSSPVEQLVYPHDQSRETQGSVNLIEHESPGAVNQLELEKMKLEYQLKTRQIELEFERESTQNEANGVGDRTTQLWGTEAVLRTFSVGQKVLAFLPSHGNPLQKRYSGPYVIKEKLSPLTYVIETPDRRKKSQLVHINLIHDYLSRTSGDKPGHPEVALYVTMVPQTVTDEEEIDEGADGENILSVDLPTSNGFFPNSHLLPDFQSYCSEVENSFCKDIKSLLSKYPEITAERPGTAAYLDDVVVVADRWEEHLSRLNDLFQRLRDAVLTIHLRKSVFGRGTVTYLGHVVGGGSLRPKEANIRTILAFPIHRTRKEVMRFVGMVGYYRRFCVNFETIAAPLTQLTSPKAPFNWTVACVESFNKLKTFLTSKPVLKTPVFDHPSGCQWSRSWSGTPAASNHLICTTSCRFLFSQTETTSGQVFNHREGGPGTLTSGQEILMLCTSGLELVSFVIFTFD
ncbi:hypothetical protein Pmani_003108 [Petrolisthes manimaculis]|uniref:RNA-directed DNA polymerase n=1 Tax=Petrolisthes manimaculis TaxID=1843537 RepID=A0AAE1QJ72_9EUCA|nr:hypothetical protein Pmani_003108 [Petrolisthes manimaculis]